MLRYYEIINVGGIIGFELVEIECVNVVNFGNYSLFGAIHKGAGKVRRKNFKDFIIL